MSIKIAVLNLMPNKVETERHLKNKICSLDKNLDFTFIKTATYVSKNTDSKYLNNYYKELNEIKNQQFDAFVCTGAPLEKIPFESVIYWKELKEIFNWARKKTFSSYFICWGAQAALYHHYGIDKYLMEKKISGVFFPINNGFKRYFF
jgi:homoserine O-succinyltransferase